MANSRREFLAGAGGIAAAAWARPAWAAAAGSNERRVSLGLVGPGGQGTNLLRAFAQVPGVEITWVCDIDENRLSDAWREVKQANGREPKQSKDLRRVLDDKSVDAVVVATPDHWHAPATILACDAGKHVYVEKPASHNVREGRLMIDAARRNKRVVQVGTQSRSASYVIEAMRMLREGVIGEVLVSKAWNSQRRGDIGRRQPTEPPSHVDYDTWVGPAPLVPFQGNRFHSNWHWWFNFGTGDIGNDGVHDIDIARWGLGVETHPSAVTAMGGKLFFDNDQEFPDTQYVVYHYEAPPGGGKAKQLIYEQRLWSPYVQEGFENGNAFYGTKGQLVLSKKRGWRLYEQGNNEQSAIPKRSDESKDSRLGITPHAQDFIDCVREGNDARRPNADIEIGHLSSSLSHLGNIASRVGRTVRFDPLAEKVVGDPEAQKLVGREYRAHWSVPKGA